MKRSPLKPISSKRAKDMVKYRKAKKEYLEEHLTCERCECCAATEIHHKRSRIGKLLYDKRYFMALCDLCHKFVHANPKYSMEQGWLMDRLSPFTNI